MNQKALQEMNLILEREKDTLKSKLVRRIKDARLVDESNPEQTVLAIVEEVFNEKGLF